MIEFLLDHGANFDKWGESPFDHAVRYPNVEVIKLLVKRGIYPSTKFALDWETIMTKENLDFREMLNHLEERGVDITQKDVKGETVFSAALCAGRLDIMESFLTYPNLDPISQNHKGRSALHHAAKLGSLAIVEPSWKFKESTSTYVMIAASARCISL